MDPRLAAKFHISPPVRTRQDRFLNRVKPVIRLYAFLRAELRKGIRVSLRKRLRAWRFGFFPASYLLYDIDRNNPLDYLPDTNLIDFTLRDSHHLTLSNKLSFSRLMELYGMPHPRVLATLSRGRCHVFDRSQRNETSLAAVLRLLINHHGSIVLKPVQIGMGLGIIIVGRSAYPHDGDKSERVTINGVPSNIDELVELVTPLEDYYLSSFVTQARYAAEIFADTPNTVRVLTLWDYDRDAPFLATAVQRIGTSRSYPVDNFHQGFGGVSAMIDGDTGILGLALTLTDQGQRVPLTHHPETGRPIEGVRVPHWEKAKGALLRVAAELPQMPFVGWDLIITEQFYSCLEANCPPGVAVWQAHVPLLADPRSRRCFETLGLI